MHLFKYLTAAVLASLFLLASVSAEEEKTKAKTEARKPSLTYYFFDG